MEKLHKYCLSVLLVIICSNISAQVTNGTTESEDCKQLYELYNQILNHDFEVSGEFRAEKQGQNLAIHDKGTAADLIGKICSGKNCEHSYKNKSETAFSNKERHDQLLKNFEKNSKENLFAEILYFKTRVSKVRNKDDLELIG